ncbi:MAG: penicillin-binding protein 2 [Actinomycetota bacterium]|nr:penicillin-binding protein 2 [Actinomycetota bacterium]
MNREVSRLAMAGLALIVALIAGTTYWQTWAAAGLADRQDNAIQRVAQFTIRRGLIYMGDGRRVLASNVPKRVAGRTLYFRRYPRGRLTAHVVGYSTQARAQAGLERSMNDYLVGANANLSTVLDTTIDRLTGATVTGNDLVLTLDAVAQRTAMAALAGKCGSAVALDPRTGRVLAMASSPSFDPNLVETDYRRIERASGPCPRPSGPLLNRATYGLYTPGSTFKVLTAAAALDSGRYTPDSRFLDPGYCIEYGKRVSNAGNPEVGPEVFGSVDFTQALEHSINSVFCNIGKDIGAGTIIRYMKRFGFYAVPPLETPLNERAPSGLYRKGELFDPDQPQFQVDPGRLAFGQERLQVTPLQMAMVVAAIANGGSVMRPYVVDRVVAPDGSIVSRTRPEKLGQAVSARTASQVASMMEAAVRSGTGTRAFIPGARVAGKTGTAETGTANLYTTAFVSFASVDDPRVAVAVILERQRGFGGETAAPIAKEIMQAILRRG